MATRYFNSAVDGHMRISVVTADDDGDIYGCMSLDARDREIEPHNLPDDFASWKRYEASGDGTVTVYVMSRDGD